MELTTMTPDEISSPFQEPDQLSSEDETPNQRVPISLIEPVSTG